VRHDILRVTKNNVVVMLPPSSEIWRQHGPLEHLYPTTSLHSIITQKITT